MTYRTEPSRPHELGTILSIWAHPDDETYLAGGVMAAARRAGQRVVCVSITAGERGTDDPDRWPPGRLAETRRWEAAAAMAVLGVAEHEVLAFPDGGVQPADELALRRVGTLIDMVDPDTILTFGPDGMTFHPDHIAVHQWVTAAWHASGHEARLLYATSSVEFIDRYRDQFEEWDMYMTDERPTGVPTDELGIHERLDGWALDRKLAALRAMTTQTSGLIAMLGEEAYGDQVGEESFVEATASDGADDGVAGLGVRV